MPETTDFEYPCSDLIVFIEEYWAGMEIELPINEWIKNGPGGRFGIYPYRVVCRSDDTVLPLSAIPLQYRNDDLAQILISLGILEYPWDYAEKYQIPTKIEIDESNQIGRIIIHEDVGAKKPLLGYGQFEMVAVPGWVARLAIIFGRHKVLLTNSPERLDNNAIATIWTPRDSNDQLVIMDSQVERHGTSEEVLREILPGSTFGQLVQNQIQKVADYDVRYAIIDSEKHSLSLVVLVLKLEDMDDDESLWFRFFGMTNLGNGGNLVKELVKICLSLRAL